MTAISEHREHCADEADAGDRLDRFMAQVWTDVSRSRCKALIEAGHVFADDQPVTEAKAKIRAGVIYRLELPEPVAAAPEPEPIALDIVFEDDHLVVINKAAGMAVHPAAGHWSGTLVHALLHHCAGSLSGIGGVERPGIVHRLDKDTSGVMVAAKSDAAHQGLQKLFARHDIERVYTAFVRGAPRPKAGRIEARLARSTQDRKKMTVIAERDQAPGKWAITNYALVKAYGQVPKASVGSPLASKIECRLETGRTHQIRVHMAHIGCPLLGDPVYGKTRSQLMTQTGDGKTLRDFRRQALHASVLGFVHPVTGEEMRFETALPDDMQRLEGFLEGL